MPVSPIAPVPPLPQPLPLPVDPAILDPATPLKPWPIKIRSVRCGCYLIQYIPTGSSLVAYDGTMRVQCHSNGRTASGDLYQRPTLFIPPFPPKFPPKPPLVVLAPPPNPAAGIPILPRNKYRYYLSISQILENFTFGNSFTLGFQRWRFNAATAGSPASWTNEGNFTAEMSWIPAPAGYPSAGNYLEGDVKDAANTVVGRLKMGWVSSYLRKATIEIDRVPQAESPLNNGSTVDWKAVGDSIDWDITVDQSNSDIAEPSGESWSNAECHATMLTRRAAVSLDVEWRYHVLCVRRLDATERGIMYDNGATDSNNVPREGCAISSHWVIPNTASWGLVKGMRFGTATAPYFRTAVHETGHAMGLYHNTVDNGYLNTTDVIAASATAANPFPNNIKWSYAPDDQKRLRHMPDIHVRPGGTPFGTSYGTTPISPDDAVFDAQGVVLSVKPLIDAVPLGAPVRVEVSLQASDEGPVEVPPSLSLGSGFVRGVVIDPSGTARSFSPLVLCTDHESLKTIEKNQSVTDSLTLLRGGQGALFPSAGVYTIQVEAHWETGGAEISAVGTTNVIVTPPVDDAHASAALKILSTPDTLLTVVLGGDHLTEGIEAIQQALSNPMLRPHYAYIEAKRLASRFGKRKPDQKAAVALLDDASVLSDSERKKAAKFSAAPKGA
jgi:hypothetical protein